MLKSIGEIVGASRNADIKSLSGALICRFYGSENSVPVNLRCAGRSCHTFACFVTDCRDACGVRQTRGHCVMNGSLFAELDRICGQFALALHNAELQVYAVLTLLLVLGILLFPPRNDPDQA